MFFDVLALARTWPITEINYKNPPTRGDENWYITAIFLSGATVAVWTRLYARIFVRRWVGLDDVLILVSWLCSIMITALVGIGNSSYGWNRHIWDLPPDLYSGAAHILYVSRLAWALATSFVRLSVLILYYRLLQAASAPRHYFIVNHVVLASVLILLAYYIFSEVFTCWPIAGYWEWPSPPNLRCMDDGTSLTVSGGVNTFSEFIVATLPWVAVFRLGVDRRQRWAVIGVLCLGYLIVLVGCLRTYYLYKIFEDYDLTWWATPQWICTEVELDVAIMCACAAPLRPVVGRTARRFRGIRTPSPEKGARSWFNSKGSRDTDTTQVSSASRNSLEHMTVSEWRAAMSRTIDLEGIATDGMGYTIRIAGPTKREQAELRVKQNMAKAGLITLGESSKKPHHDIEKQIPQKGNNKYALREIEAKTEVDVRESFHSSSYGARAWGFTPAERQQHEGLSPFHADDLDFETSALTPTDADERPWTESPTSATFSNRQRDLSKNPTFFESVESLEALPTMPSPPEYSYNAGSSRPAAASVFAKGLNKKRSAG